MEHSHSHILEVSWNGGTPKSSIWFSDCHGFSIITHPASSSYWGTPIYEPPILAASSLWLWTCWARGSYLEPPTNLVRAEGATSWIWARWTMVPAIKHIPSSWSYFSLVIEYPKTSHTPQLHHVERAVTTCATRLTTVGHLAIGDLATQLGTRWVQFQWTISTCNTHMLARPFKLWHMWIVGCQMRTQTQTFEIPSWQTHLGSVYECMPN